FCCYTVIYNFKTENMTKKYTNGEITIVWKPGVCIHSTVCWKQATGLPEVFNPAEHPWIKPEAATTERIIEQVNKCPSGALSFYFNEAGAAAPEQISAETKIEVTPNGPLLVYGNIVVKDREGNEIRKSKVTAFCRCGKSGNKPFCDGSHIKENFSG
ncbi:MAG TPA: (4Fe-4S)-binding protein, partial [Chitinophagaceae bacterium]|nr:(4Fe-4S)-binding protein [Chitinophagaceae bacterium]